MDRTAFPVLCVVVVSLAASANAKPPTVRFDMMPVVVCRDVTDDESTAVHPDERLLEATFEISSILASGSEADLTEYLYRMTSPQQSFRIVDYSPRTTLVSDYIGGITIETQERRTRSRPNMSWSLRWNLSPQVERFKTDTVSTSSSDVRGKTRWKVPRNFKSSFVRRGNGALIFCTCTVKLAVFNVELFINLTNKCGVVLASFRSLCTWLVTKRQNALRSSSLSQITNCGRRQSTADTRSSAAATRRCCTNWVACLISPSQRFRRVGWNKL